jgi:hypothetical protein
VVQSGDNKRLIRILRSLYMTRGELPPLHIDALQTRGWHTRKFSLKVRVARFILVQQNQHEKIIYQRGHENTK